jgi:hypothetical protein
MADYELVGLLGTVLSGPLRLALIEFKHIKKHVFVRMGKKCTPASGSSTLPRRTRPYKLCIWCPDPGICFRSPMKAGKTPVRIDVNFGNIRTGQYPKIHV